MEICAESDIGKVRTSNEDCYDFEIINRSLAWALVCDGMGGANFGEVASKMAKETVRDELTKYFRNVNLDSLNSNEIKEIMLKGIENSNTVIYNKAKESKFSGMATTIVLALIYADNLHIAHVGDSRAYVLNKNEIRQLTEDHSVVRELVKKGRLSASDAKSHPQKNIITRAVGASSSVQIDYSCTKFKEGDFVFLCTDGLSSYLENEEIFSYFCKYKGEAFVKKLIDVVNSLGGKDNTTVLLVSNSNGL